MTRQTALHTVEVNDEFLSMVEAADLSEAQKAELGISEATVEDDALGDVPANVLTETMRDALA